MFDPSKFVVSGISLLAVVFGLVEFIKTNFHLEGKKVTVLAAGLGVVLAVLYQLQTVLPAPYSQVYEIVIVSVTFGLSASGYYKFINSRLPRQAG